MTAGTRTTTKIGTRAGEAEKEKTMRWAMLPGMAVLGLLMVHSNMAVAQPAQPAPLRGLELDLGDLPPPPNPQTNPAPNLALLMGTGAVIGVVLADIVSGGALLAPLGAPSTWSVVGGRTATAAAGGAAAGYSLAQRIMAAVATATAAVLGGYIVEYLARTNTAGLMRR